MRRGGDARGKLRRVHVFGANPTESGAGIDFGQDCVCVQAMSSAEAAAVWFKSYYESS